MRTKGYYVVAASGDPDFSAGRGFPVVAAGFLLSDLVLVETAGAPGADGRQKIEILALSGETGRPLDGVAITVLKGRWNPTSTERIGEAADRPRRPGRARLSGRAGMGRALRLRAPRRGPRRRTAERPTAGVRPGRRPDDRVPRLHGPEHLSAPPEDPLEGARLPGRRPRGPLPCASPVAGHGHALRSERPVGRKPFRDDERLRHGGGRVRDSRRKGARRLAGRDVARGRRRVGPGRGVQAADLRGHAEGLDRSPPPQSARPRDRRGALLLRPAGLFRQRALERDAHAELPVVVLVAGIPTPTSGPRRSRPGTSALQADGSFTIAFTPKADERLAGQSATTYHYAVSADASDEGGETRSATRTFRLGFVAVEARIDLPGGVPARGRPVRGHGRPDEPRRGAARGSGRVAPLPPRATVRGAAPGGPSAGSDRDGEGRPPDAGRRSAPPVADRVRGGAGHGAVEERRRGGAGRAHARREGHRADRGREPSRRRLPPASTGPATSSAPSTRRRASSSSPPASTPLALPAVLLVEAPSVPVGGTARLLAASGLAGQNLYFEIDRDGTAGRAARRSSRGSRRRSSRSRSRRGIAAASPSS